MSTRRTNLCVFLVLMLMLMPTQFSLAYTCACACACAYAYALVITRLDQHEGVEFRWLLPMLSFTRRLRSRWLPFSGFRYIKGRAQNLWVFGWFFRSIWLSTYMFCILIFFKISFHVRVEKNLCLSPTDSLYSRHVKGVPFLNWGCMKGLRSNIPKVCKRVRGFGNRSGACPQTRLIKGCWVAPWVKF